MTSMSHLVPPLLKKVEMLNFNNRWSCLRLEMKDNCEDLLIKVDTLSVGGVC